MNIVIIEDEAYAAERLEQMIKELNPEYRVVVVLSSVKESITWLSKNHADLIFLDIQLSDGLSFSIFDEVQISTPVIFTTAYQSYAIKAFSLNSISYLLKPIVKKDLKDSLDKLNRLNSVFTPEIRSVLNALKDKTGSYKHRFMIKIGERFKLVSSTEIAYFFARDKAVFLKTFDNKTLPIDFTLDRLEDEVDPAIFFRINRAYIININAIENMFSWSKSRIKLDLTPAISNDEHSIVSVKRTIHFKEWISS
jgi:DNA-binding LytR/AlgR family response regulator